MKSHNVGGRVNGPSEARKEFKKEKKPRVPVLFSLYIVILKEEGLRRQLTKSLRKMSLSESFLEKKKRPGHNNWIGKGRERRILLQDQYQ